MRVEEGPYSMDCGSVKFSIGDLVGHGIPIASQCQVREVSGQRERERERERERLSAVSQSVHRAVTEIVRRHLGAQHSHAWIGTSWHSITRHHTNAAPCELCILCSTKVLV